MGTLPLWLPDLVLFSDYGGNWDDYEDIIYDRFLTDLVHNRLYYQSLPISLRRHPEYKNKEFSFWHVTSTGEKESERIPDFRRCERICWIRAIIENHSDPAVKIWENIRKGKTSVCFWLEDERYLVVLGKRSGYWLLLTAYTTDYPHTQSKLRQEYNSFKSKYRPT
jgi:hypothetical protein